MQCYVVTMVWTQHCRGWSLKQLTVCPWKEFLGKLRLSRRSGKKPSGRQGWSFLNTEGWVSPHACSGVLYLRSTQPTLSCKKDQQSVVACVWSRRLWRLRQENHLSLEFEARLGYKARHCLKKKTKYYPSCCKEYGFEGKYIPNTRDWWITEWRMGIERGERMNGRSNSRGIWQALAIGMMRKKREPRASVLPAGWVAVLIRAGMTEKTGVQDQKRRVLCLVSGNWQSNVKGCGTSQYPVGINSNKQI